jgi:hypothetical protein
VIQRAATAKHVHDGLRARSASKPPG